MPLTAIDKIEWINIFLGIFSIPLNMYRRIEVWYINIAMSSLTVFAFYHRQVYSRCFIGTLSMAMALYGWYSWTFKKKDKKKPKPITTTSAHEWLLLLALASAAIVPSYLLLQKLAARLSLPGSISFIMTLVGMWLSAEKKLETPLFWSGYNLLAIYETYLSGSQYFYKYLLYLVCAPYTYHLWYKAYKKQDEPGNASHPKPQYPR